MRRAPPSGSIWTWTPPWTWSRTGSSRPAAGRGSRKTTKDGCCAARWASPSLGGATLDNEENYLIKKLFTAAGAVQIENQARI